MRHRFVVPLIWLVAALCLSLSSPGRLAAQTASLTNGDGMDAHLFRPAIDSKGYLSVNGTSILGDGDYSFGLILDAGFGILPVTAFDVDNEANFDEAEDIDRVISTAITGTLHFNYGIANIVVVGVQVPIMVLNGPNVVLPGYYNDQSVRPVGLDSQGLGNLIVHGKARILRHESNPVGLAGILQLELPTGDATTFRGEPGFSAWPILAMDWVPVPIFRVGLNVGYRLVTGDPSTVPYEGVVSAVGPTDNGFANLMAGPRDELCFGGAPMTARTTEATCPSPVTGQTDVEYGSLTTFGAAASLRFSDSAELVAEVYGANVGSDFGGDGSLGAETIGGLKIYTEANSYLVLAGGIGVPGVKSVNSADIRAVLGFIFEPSIGDRDGDGYKDDVDECPDDPEDFDHFEDEDGCPEPDNDRDGILDVDDECPLVPEDHDGDADEDGCPEGTIGDRDGDGILDNVDECPDDPEDRDGFQDADGCPDPDNDNDGILDVDDLCPNDPEDKDNFEDEDGCPDLDNDKDRILDVDDSCPNDPETYNGHEDEDGCPDRGNVIIEENEIIILDKIFFATDSAEILAKSFPIVDAVAATLVGNPQITLIEIQGHADERGSDDYNVRLTSDRAASVRQALIQRGVDSGRLRSGGYGERCPVDPNHDADAWEKNRRVEFKIIRTDAGPTGVEVACPAGRELIPE